MTVELESERIEQMMLARWAAPRLDNWPRGNLGDAIHSNIAFLLQIYGAQDGPLPLPVQLISAALANDAVI